METPKPLSGLCIFTVRGIVQYMKTDEGLALLLARNLREAKPLAKWMQSRRKDGKRVSVAEIGTMPGESFQALIQASRELGCTVIYRFEDFVDGAPRFSQIPIPGTGEES